MRFKTTLLALVCLAALASNGGAAEKEPKGDAYPLTTCPVTGGKLGSMGAPASYDHEGRDIKFCCAGCEKKFKKGADEYIKKIDAEIIKQQAKKFSLDFCVVTQAKFNPKEAGPPIDFVYKNRLVRVSSKAGVEKFKAEPAKYLAILDKAIIEKQIKDYPLKTCVITDGKLGGMGKPYDIVHANQLVRFCCKGCVKSFRKDPNKYMKKITAAKKGGAASQPAGAATRPSR